MIFKIMMVIYLIDLLFGWAFKGKNNDYWASPQKMFRTNNFLRINKKRQLWNF